MTRQLRVKLDEPTAAHLEALTLATGRSATEVVRLALAALPVEAKRVGE